MIYLEIQSLIKTASCKLRFKSLIVSYVNLNVDLVKAQGGPMGGPADPSLDASFLDKRAEVEWRACLSLAPTWQLGLPLSLAD